MLLVSAAASLQDVMQELKPHALQQLERDGYPPVTLTFNFAGSGTLQRQIEQGAPADVFVSAAEKQMDALQSARLLLENSQRIVTRNRMVLVAPNSPTTGLDINSFSDLADDRVQTVAIAQPHTVPAGQYAREVLTQLDLFEPLANKLVFGKDVRQVLSYVDTGNVDAGLVYATDAARSLRVRTIAMADESSHSPILYPAAALSSGKHPDLARAFIDILASPMATAIFQSYGFQPF